MYVFIDFNPAFQEFHHKMTFLAFYFSQLVLPRSKAIIFIFSFITPKACKPNTLSTLPHNIIRMPHLQSKLSRIKAITSFFHNAHRSTSSTARLDLSSQNDIKTNYRTLNTKSAAVEDVCGEHSGFNIAVTEKQLHAEDTEAPKNQYPVPSSVKLPSITSPSIQQADKKTSVIPGQKRKYLYGFLTTQYTKQLLRLFSTDVIVRRMCILAHSRTASFSSKNVTSAWNHCPPWQF